MKKLYFLSLLVSVLLFNGCFVIGGVFKAGTAAGIISTIVVIIFIIWIISLLRGKN